MSSEIQSGNKSCDKRLRGMLINRGMWGGREIEAFIGIPLSRKNKYRLSEVKHLYLLFPQQCTHGRKKGGRGTSAEKTGRSSKLPL